MTDGSKNNAKGDEFDTMLEICKSSVLGVLLMYLELNPDQVVCLGAFQ